MTFIKHPGTGRKGGRKGGKGKEGRRKRDGRLEGR
jgi:hypothetical protein